MLKIDGHDDAIIGPAMVWTEDGNLRDVLVYDAEVIRQTLMTRDGMSLTKHVSTSSSTSRALTWGRTRRSWFGQTTSGT